MWRLWPAIILVSILAADELIYALGPTATAILVALDEICRRTARALGCWHEVQIAALSFLLLIMLGMLAIMIGAVVA